MPVTAGKLEDLGVIEIVQTLVLGQMTAQIDVSPEGSEEVGTIYVWKGRVVHSKTRRWVGSEAFHQIATWERGTYVIEKDAYTEQRTVDESVDFLILESLRRLDEGNDDDGEDDG